MGSTKLDRAITERTGPLLRRGIRPSSPGKTVAYVTIRSLAEPERLPVSVLRTCSPARRCRRRLQRGVRCGLGGRTAWRSQCGGAAGRTDADSLEEFWSADHSRGQLRQMRSPSPSTSSTSRVPAGMAVDVVSRDSRVCSRRSSPTAARDRLAGCGLDVSSCPTLAILSEAYDSALWGLRHEKRRVGGDDQRDAGCGGEQLECSRVGSPAPRDGGTPPAPRARRPCPG